MHPPVRSSLRGRHRNKKLRQPLNDFKALYLDAESAQKLLHDTFAEEWEGRSDFPAFLKFPV